MNEIANKLKKSYFSERMPPISFWFLLAGKSHSTFLPSKTAWRRVWLEFKRLNKGKEKINIHAAQFYFSVQFEKERKARRLTSKVEEKWWKQIKRLTPGIKKIRHALLPESSMHLDIFLPEKMTAFEIQGEQHWLAIKKFGGEKSFALRQERDARKRNICRKLGIKLIEISDYTSISFIAEALNKIS